MLPFVGHFTSTVGKELLELKSVQSSICLIALESLCVLGKHVGLMTLLDDAKAADFCAEPKGVHHNAIHLVVIPQFHQHNPHLLPNSHGLDLSKRDVGFHISF